MSEKSCCARCFRHPWLVKFIRENASERGTCDFCGTEDVDVLAVSHLLPAFENALNAFNELDESTLAPYEEAYRVGEPIIFLFQDSWRAFNDDEYLSGNSANLFDAVMASNWDYKSVDRRIRADDLYTSRRRYWSPTAADDWEEFCEKVKRTPDLTPTFSNALSEDVWGHSATLPKDAILYRARQGWDVTSSDGTRVPYTGKDMGAPPPNACTSSRANVAGQSVLYVAEQETTAIAEIRPPRGQILSVATLVTTRELQVFDLAEPVPQANPFTADPLKYWVEHVELLNAFRCDLPPIGRTS